jgi:hypothetical protein
MGAEDLAEAATTLDVQRMIEHAKRMRGDLPKVNAKIAQKRDVDEDEEEEEAPPSSSIVTTLVSKSKVSSAPPPPDHTNTILFVCAIAILSAGAFAYFTYFRKKNGKPAPSQNYSGIMNKLIHR